MLRGAYLLHHRNCCSNFTTPRHPSTKPSQHTAQPQLLPQFTTPRPQNTTLSQLTTPPKLLLQSTTPKHQSTTLSQHTTPPQLLLQFTTPRHPKYSAEQTYYTTTTAAPVNYTEVTILC
jgi:hypothetical protein